MRLGVVNRLPGYAALCGGRRGGILGFLARDRPRCRQEARADDVGNLANEFPQQAARNIQANAELFREPLVTLRPPHQRRVTAFGEPGPRIPGECVGDVDVAKSHQRVRQRFVEHLSAADRQQMLLATAFDDFKKICVRQAVGTSQDRRGHLRLFVERKLADRLARGPFDG